MLFKTRSWLQDINLSIASYDLKKILELSTQGLKISSYHLLPSGNITQNYEIKFSDQTSKILQITSSQNRMLFKEKAIKDRLDNCIFCANTELIGSYSDYYYAIIENKKGILLKDFLAYQSPDAIQSIMYQLGQILGTLSKLSFASQGDLDENLKLTQVDIHKELAHFVEKSVQELSFRYHFDKTLIPLLLSTLKKPSLWNGAQLIHGQFDQENILINSLGGKWKVSAILDWKHAFSGSILFDVASLFKAFVNISDPISEPFVRGIQESSVILPSDWKQTLNILSIIPLLLDLKKSPPEQAADILLEIEQRTELANLYTEKAA